MTPDPVPRFAVEYLLVVEGNGDGNDVEAFVSAVGQPGQPGRLFVPSLAVPVPAGLLPVDPFAIPYYHITQNQYLRAAEALDALDAEPELAALLREPGRRLDAQSLLNRTLDRAALEGVRAVRSNLRAYNALTREQWARQNWGGLDDRLSCSRLERPSARSAHLRFDWPALNVGILSALAEAHSHLGLGLIAVNPAESRQAYAWHDHRSANFAHGAGSLREGGPSWLEAPPPPFPST